ncbi:MAG: hypothetical protein QOG03_834 [Actinomycetota bacterium]|jgi:hypothetical protein|nr:hypothetical protein [Actinomycetota bacterium]
MRGLAPRAALVGLLLAGSLAFAGSPNAAAQTAAAAAATTTTSALGSVATIRLVSQTPWVGQGGELDLGLVVQSPGRSDVEVAVTVRQAVTSRSAFAQTLAGRFSSAVIDVTSATLAELKPTPTGGVFVRLPVQDPSQPRDRSRLLLRSAGVYPVVVELRTPGDGRVLDRFVTHLLYAPTAAKQKLGVAWVVPFHAAPAIEADGRRRLPPATAAGLAGLSHSIASHPTVPLTLAPTPETLEAMGSDRTDAPPDEPAIPPPSPTRQIVTGPFVALDLPAFEGALATELVAQTTKGTEILTTAIGRRPDLRTRVVDGALTTDSLARLQAQQVDRVILPERDLAAIALRVTLTQPFQLAIRQGSRVDAVAADSGLTDHFVTGGSQVLAAHQLLADLAVVYFDSPGLTRGVVALPPRAWRADPSFVDAVLAGLTASPVVQGLTLDQLFETVPAARTPRRLPLVRTLNTSQPFPSLPADQINATRTRLDSFGAVLDSDNPLFGSIDSTLLASESGDLRPGPRNTYLQAINRRILSQTSRIRVPKPRTITLTSRSGEVPITIVSDLPYPVHVVVQVSSDKLRFPAGSTKQVDLLHANTTLRVPVAARASGTFPLAIRLVSPDGRLIVGESRFTVRSSAFSGIGAVLSIGAILFLVAWWVTHIVRRRHDRRLLPVSA